MMGLLAMEGHWIVHRAADVPLAEKRLELVAPLTADDELVIDVAAEAGVDGERDGEAVAGRLRAATSGKTRLAERLTVERRVSGALIRPAVEVPELHPENRRLQRVEPEVPAHLARVVLGLEAVVA